jgi:hypothetical protein
MHHPNELYRSLETLCRHQAKLSSHPGARKELESMALEYKRLADWLDRQWPEPDRPK